VGEEGGQMADFSNKNSAGGGHKRPKISEELLISDLCENVSGE